MLGVYFSLYILLGPVCAQLKACYYWDQASAPDAGNLAPNYDRFSYSLNTTICSDATVCPKNDFSTAENQTCCDKHQGKPEIIFRNNAQIPTDLADLTSYYASAGQTIPTDGVYKTSTYSTYTTTMRTTDAATTGPTTTPSPTSSPSPTPSPSSGLSNGAKAGTGIGVTVGAIVIALTAYFLWMRRRKAIKKNADAPASAYRDYSGVPQEPTLIYSKSELPTDSQVIEMDALSPSERGSRLHEMLA
ncbi:MAG: hypothetical protein L6R39_001957 [Caloplaca ligustica]|nr:MAG: hypothetical protein L6R39_001957 [Caloplaca ligustica]